MNGQQISIFKQMDKIGLTRLLEGLDGRTLPPQPEFVSGREHVPCVVVRNLADDAGKGETTEEEVGGFLVASDLAEGNGAGFVALLWGNGDGVAGEDTGADSTSAASTSAAGGGGANDTFAGGGGGDDAFAADGAAGAGCA